MRKKVTGWACVQNETVVVSAERRENTVEVEAARAVVGISSGRAGVQFAVFPCGTAAVSRAKFSICQDGKLNRERLAHFLCSCCAAVTKTEMAQKETEGGLGGKKKI